MAPWWWSWLLTAVGLFGLFLAGRKDWRGWAVGLAAQGLWIAYAVTTQQWGFILAALAYGGVYWLNLVRWLRADREDRVETEAADGAHFVP